VDPVPDPLLDRKSGRAGNPAMSLKNRKINQEFAVIFVITSKSFNKNVLSILRNEHHQYHQTTIG
jgi:hypothetical protein